MHRHPGSVAVFMTDINGKFTFPDGKTQDVTSKAGQTQWTPAAIWPRTPATNHSK